MPTALPAPTATALPPGKALRPDTRVRNPRSGLTLVELLTVIAIISILISILIPTVSTVRTSARKAKARIILTQWATAMEMFRQEYGFYPAFDISGDDDNLLATPADADEFVKALSGREVDGSPIGALDTASGNKKRIRFYTFSEGEISEDGKIVDDFGGNPIAILFDKDYDGIITVESGADYTAFPDIGHGATAPPNWPKDPDTGDPAGLRAGVAIYSPGPGGAGNIITTW